MAKPGRGTPESGYQPDSFTVDLSEFDTAVAKEQAVVEELSFKLGVAKSRLKIASDDVRRDEALALVEHFTGEVRRAIAREARARAARARARGLSSL